MHAHNTVHIGEVGSYLRKSSAFCVSICADARIIIIVIPFTCAIENLAWFTNRWNEHIM